MTNPTVYAVVTATIEIAVRSSSARESLESMHAIAKSEAESKLRALEHAGIKVVGPVKFSHAVVKVNES